MLSTESFSVLRNPSIYRYKPKEGERTKIGGANAPPTASTKLGQVATPGGTCRCFDVLALSPSEFSVWVLDFDETSFDFRL